MKRLVAALVLALAAEPAFPQEAPLASAERLARRIALQGPIHRSLENALSSPAVRMAAENLGSGLDGAREDLGGQIRRAVSPQTTTRPPHGSTNYFKTLLLVGILFVAVLAVVLSSGID